MALTERQIWLVQTSFEKLIVNIDSASDMFYRRLLELVPALGPMFKHSRQVQGRKLMTMVLFFVNGLDSLDSLKPQIELLSSDHVGYGVRPGDYETLRQALIWTLKDGLGHYFTPETEAAWNAVYRVIADTAIQAGYAAAN